VVIRIANTCTTATAGARRTIRVHKRLDQNLLEISGTMPANDRGWDGTVSVSRPAEFFASMLRQKLLERGITVTGNHRYERRTDGTLPSGVEIGRIESAPMSVIAAQTMKPSQNMYTETLLWTLGEMERNLNLTPGGGSAPVSNADSGELGISAVKKFLTGIGVAPDSVVQHDGSGLSRHNLITPSAVVQLYNYMGKSRHAQAWRDSLTVGGVDGTLRNRFKGTRAQGNVRGKTGTIDQVSALSGYVRTAAGEELAFSMVVNGVPEPGTRTSLIDEMALALANFNGRVDQ
jgi:D-alanyl-D-alanine carboxypeptidase/D-alanyl-D-alanine-endopeptidase (penicillin-binding protein 4)